LYEDYPLFVDEVSQHVPMSAEEQHIAKSMLPALWAYWGLALFSGDESTPYPPGGDPELWGVPFFGNEVEKNGRRVVDFSAGELAERVQHMYESDDPDAQRRFARLSSRVAWWTFRVGAVAGFASEEWCNFMPTMPQTLIKPDRAGQLHVHFPDGNKDVAHPIEKSCRTIMNFGPGLTGMVMGGELIGHTQKIECVSGGIGATYISSWLEINMRYIQNEVARRRQDGTLQATISPQFKAARVRPPELCYSNHGISAHVDALNPKSRYDIMLLSSVHSAGVTESHAAIRGAAKHLREGGLFVVKAPDVSLGHEAGMDRIADYAAEHLGSPAASGPCGELRQNLDPNLSRDRAASFAIYQKQ